MKSMTNLNCAALSNAEQKCCAMLSEQLYSLDKGLRRNTNLYRINFDPLQK